MTRLIAMLLIASCASVQPSPSSDPAPPAETWPICSMLCQRRGEVFLGVLMPTPQGPLVCACGTGPVMPNPQTWET
jgi:hypothetical protein